MSRDPEAAALIAEIDREASGERERILNEARARAREIMAAADLRVRRAQEDGARLAQKQARVDEDRLLGRARMEEDAERLGGMRSAYQRAFQAAQERIDALAASPAYPDAMKALLDEALEKVPCPGRVCVAHGDAGLCREALRETGVECEVAEEDLPPGSMIIFDAEGTVKVDNSLRARLAMAQEVLETPVAKCLASAIT